MQIGRFSHCVICVPYFSLWKSVASCILISTTASPLVACKDNQILFLSKDGLFSNVQRCTEALGNRDLYMLCWKDHGIGVHNLKFWKWQVRPSVHGSRAWGWAVQSGGKKRQQKCMPSKAVRDAEDWSGTDTNPISVSEAAGGCMGWRPKAVKIMHLHRIVETYYSLHFRFDRLIFLTSNLTTCLI